MTDTDPQLQADGNQEPERPEWLPENFKSPEALVESYKSSQAEMNRAIQREKELQQQIEHYESFVAAQQQQAPPQQYDPSADPLIVAYETAMEQADYRTALAIQAQVGTLAAQRELQQALPTVTKQNESLQQAQAALVADHAWTNLRSRYGDDLESHRDQIAAAIQAQPWLIPDEASRDPNVAATAIENVYKIVNPNAFVQGIASDMTAQKLAAQSLPGAAGRPPATNPADEEWKQVMAAAKKEPGQYW